MMRRDGPFVVSDRRREEPHYAPANFMETSFERVSYQDYMEKRIMKLHAVTNGSCIWPYPAWMEMGDRPGHLLTTWSGIKLNSIEELPTECRGRVEREWPERLEVDRTAFSEWKTNEALLSQKPVQRHQGLPKTCRRECAPKANYGSLFANTRRENPCHHLT